jgi:tRNA 2-selenouridine synthase
LQARFIRYTAAMPVTFASLAAVLDHGFDTVIDVRSPAEYLEDHIPGAISLPALSNSERAEVGTIYKQVSPFKARKIGAALVARNVAAHLEGPLADHDGAWRPLVYCWRGGQRSGSFASILSQIGWRTETVSGGYQSFRKLVHAVLYETPLPHRLILLDGNTGTAKTEILARLAQRGMQVIDLEGLAGHRGSLLGGLAGGQPSQRAFETALAVALAGLDPGRPIVIEAESSKIGRLNVPPTVWAAMCAAQRVVIKAPLAARATYLTETYADVIADPADLAARLQPLRFHRGHAVVEGWLARLDAGDYFGLATALIEQHYDAAYAHSSRLDTRDVIGIVAALTLDDSGQSAAAARIEAMITAG